MDNKTVIEASIRRFLEWLERNGTAGYDPYDLWSSRFGTRARRLYYRYGNLAAPIVAPLVLADRIAPSAARITTSKGKYATSHGHLILGFLDLYMGELDGSRDWLDRAKQLAEELNDLKISGYSGDCWGYPFDWENRRGLWPKNTPLITVTPYCFEALVALYEASAEEVYKERARSILQFALADLNNTEISSGAVASSYSPLDRSLVINASAYRAFVLIRGGEMFDRSEAVELGNRLGEFVLESQWPDGSWPYALEANGDDFVDHFHTCFVLKNLTKVFKLNSDNRILQAIENGYAFYKEKLFDKDSLPIPFAVGGNRLLRYSMYDFAESISLGVLLRDLVPGAFERSRHIALETAKRFQLPDGHFVTSIGRMGLADKLAFIRWPQAQMFHAFTSLWRALN